VEEEPGPGDHGETYLDRAQSAIDQSLQLAHSSAFIRVGDWGNPALTAAAAALSDLVGHDIQSAVIAGVLAELAQRYEHLDEDEMAVFDLLRRLAQGGSIYKVWIDENDLLEAMDSELDLEARRRLLANMKSRELLEEGAGKWRAVF
jgi:hypothetical protein